MQYSLFFLVWTALSTLSTALSAPNQGETRFSVDPTTADKRERSCDCYSVSGSDPGHFQHHKFWDFRQVPLNALAVKDFQFQPVTQADASAIHQNKDFNAAPILLKDTPFAADWLIQDWQRSGSLLFPIPIANSNKNAFLTRSLAGGTSFLAMRTKRFEKYSSTAEIETARLPPSTGACVGIFTFFSRTSESDIEILTSDPPNRAHYANQPDYDPIRNVVIPGSQVAVDSHVPWTTWSTYRLDWFPGMSRWYVENQLQASLAYGVPVDPSRLIVNIWSDGGLWSGNLTVGNSVHLGIEWIEIAYNLTGEAPQPCNTVCRIDNVAHPGVPEM
uniref:Beta-glucanase n=1 Tax=Talaromyces marneffei PM1 TaxID=1077442 RepID=A0A093UZK7_TALMA